MVAKNTPSLPANVDRQLRAAIEKMAETTDTGAGLRGNPEDRYIRVVDLLNMGLAKKLGGAAQRLVSGQNLVSDSGKVMTIPPKPEGLDVNGGIGTVFLTWRPVQELYSNHSYTEIWRAESDNIDSAVMIAQTAITFMHTDSDVHYTKTYYYWIRFVSTADVRGPWNSPAGTSGQTKQDPAELLDLLAGEIRESQLHAELTTRIDLIDEPLTGLIAKSQQNAQAIVAEAQSRAQAVADEAVARAQAITAEVAARQSAVSGEANNRATAILAEATARQNAIDTAVQTLTAADQNNAAAIQNEVTARTTAVAAEATQRNTLAAQFRGDYTGSDLAAVTSGLLYQEKLQRTTAIDSLTQQTALLSAGANTQFDHVKLWHFDALEGWTGNYATPTLNAGWLRYANGADPYAQVAVNIDVAKYPQIRARIRKIGNPVWRGYVNYSTVNAPTFTHLTAIPVPEFKDGIANLTWNMTGDWLLSNVTALVISPTYQSATDYCEIDWIAVGRPSPGASSAELYSEQLARASADSAMASDIAAANVAIAGKANSSALNALTARVDDNEAGLVSESQNLISLSNKLERKINALNTATWVTGSQDSQGTWNQSGGWNAIESGVSRIVLGGSAGVPLGPFGSAEQLWQSTEQGDGAFAGGFETQALSINSTDGAVYSVFFQHNGLVGGNFYHGTEYSAVTNIAGEVDNNPYFIVASFSVFPANRWFMAYGVIQPSGSTAGDSGLSGIYDCETGEKINGGQDFRMLPAWDGGSRRFRTYAYYHNDSAHKIWFARPNVVAVKDSLSPHALLNLDARTFANSSAISDLSSRVSETEEGIEAASDRVDVLSSALGGDSATAFSALSTKVNHPSTGLDALRESTSSAITQLESKLAPSGNLIPTDTEFSLGLSGWELGYNDSNGLAQVAWNTNNHIQPTSVKTIELRNITATSGSFSAHLRAPVAAGQRYCFSAWLSTYRCRGELLIFWLNAGGGWFDTSYGSSVINNSASHELNNYFRASTWAVAPAGAVSALLCVFGLANSASYGTAPYVFFARPSFNEVALTETVIPAYAPASAYAVGAANARATELLTTTVTENNNAQSLKYINLHSQLEAKSLVANPYFLDWAAGLPVGWQQWSSVAATQVANGVQFTTGNGQSGGIAFPIPFSDHKYIDVELSFTITSGELYGAGIALVWGGAYEVVSKLTDYYPGSYLILNKKVPLTLRLKRPPELPSNQTTPILYLMGGYSSLGALTPKTITFHSCVVTASDKTADALEILNTQVQDTGTGLVATSNKILQLNAQLGMGSAETYNEFKARVTQDQKGRVDALSTQVTALSAVVDGGVLSNLWQHDSECNGLGFLPSWGWVKLGSIQGDLIQNYSGTTKPDACGFIGQGINAASGTLAAVAVYRGDSGYGIPIIAGNSYSFRCKTMTTAGQYFNCWFYFFDAAGSSLGQTSVGGCGASAGGANIENWADLTTVHITAPANAAYLQINVYVMGTNTPAGVFGMTRFQVTSGAAGANAVAYKANQQGTFAAISSQLAAQASANSATASRVDTFKSALQGNAGGTLPAEFAAIQQQFEALNGVSAKWSVKTQVGDLVGGIGLLNKGGRIELAINADRIAFYPPEGVGSSGEQARLFVWDAELGRLVLNQVYAEEIVTNSLYVDKIFVTAATGVQAQFVKNNIGYVLMDDIAGDSLTTASVGPLPVVKTLGDYNTVLASLNIPSRIKPVGRSFVTQARLRVSKQASVKVTAAFVSINPAWVNVSALNLLGWEYYGVGKLRWGIGNQTGPAISLSAGDVVIDIIGSQVTQYQITAANLVYKTEFGQQFAYYEYTMSNVISVFYATGLADGLYKHTQANKRFLAVLSQTSITVNSMGFDEVIDVRIAQDFVGAKTSDAVGVFCCLKAVAGSAWGTTTVATESVEFICRSER